MKIVIGTDHRGFAHKEYIKQQATIAGIAISWIDVGCFSPERTDYPKYAQEACCVLSWKQAEKGILLCGSGNGMAIAANRFPGIYAALSWNEQTARSSAEEDKANILVLPADYISHEDAISLIGIWLTSPFRGGRYQERIEQIDPVA